ncbi:hypothetical protein ACFS5J_03795 [Flavobacterium chuncheonense]|uniref:Tetratricopeptide repeat protein n=1 Tax=Flavobacterium chuncheonense TaxID=2026653 RepID=A0ABW5YJK0_9FLAO
MKYLLLLLTTVLISFGTKKSKSNPYIVYTLYINKAETFILNENYSDALQFYKKAFSINIKPIAKNCFTAMQVAALENDVKSFKSFSIKGLERGLLATCFTKDSLISNFISQNHLEDFITNNTKKATKKYSKSINHFLLDTIQKLSHIDNKWKIHYLDSLSYVDSNNKTKYREKYDSIVSDIVENKLIPIIKKHGYPSERNINLEFVPNKNNPYNYSFSNNRTKLILLHYYSFPRTCDYNDLLKNEVYRGNLTAEHFAEIMDFQAKYNEEKFCKVEYYNEWHQTKDSTKFEAINNRRLEIGLSPFQEKSQKYKRGQKICKEKKENINHNQVRLFYWCG